MSIETIDKEIKELEEKLQKSSDSILDYSDPNQRVFVDKLTDLKVQRHIESDKLANAEKANNDTIERFEKGLEKWFEGKNLSIIKRNEIKTQYMELAKNGIITFSEDKLGEQLDEVAGLKKEEKDDSKKDDSKKADKDDKDDSKKKEEEHKLPHTEDGGDTPNVSTTGAEAIEQDTAEVLNPKVRGIMTREDSLNFWSEYQKDNPAQ